MALRAPVGGLSIASTTSASLQDSSTRTGFCRIPSYRTSFRGSGVGALNVTGLRLAHPRNTRFYSHGGIRKNLFDRFARSYANALVSTFEDPENILEQAIIEMNDDLIKMRP
ncbi:hypothetical protein L2E82_04830 [Cichorium intybus]|uniref:Uncharacterized protein n=1 Tax=Cichorium intybus TaxID=13427 RepID=A0ACB9H736_CICIN|nr:hypothetical protein L2E82_04830 [Cichorium intybus]